MTRRRPISYPHWIALPPLTWPLGSPLLPSDQVVLAIMVDRWRRGLDAIEIGPALLAHESGYSADTIERSIARLIKQQLLERIAQGGASAGSRRVVSTYRLGRVTLERIALDEATHSAKGSRSSRSTGGTVPPIGESEGGANRGHRAPHQTDAPQSGTGGTVPPIDGTDRGHRPGAPTGGTVPPQSYKRGDPDPEPGTAPGSPPGPGGSAEVPERTLAATPSPLADALGSVPSVGGPGPVKPRVVAFRDERDLSPPYLTQRRAAAGNVVPIDSKRGGTP